MEHCAFVSMTEKILADLPRQFLSRIENLTFVVEDWASAEVLAEFDDADPLDILGNYLGCPLPERSSGDVGALPDLVILYQGAIEAAAQASEDPLEQVIRETLIHEIAHYFGFSEEAMDEIEVLWQQENKLAHLDILRGEA